MKLFDRHLFNFEELWALRSHLKLELAVVLFLLPGYLSMITVPIFELEKVNQTNEHFSKIYFSTVKPALNEHVQCT